MEWFVVGVFTFFIGSLLWVAMEAINHARQPKDTDKTLARTKS